MLLAGLPRVFTLLVVVLVLVLVLVVMMVVTRGCARDVKAEAGYPRAVAASGEERQLH